MAETVQVWRETTIYVPGPFAPDLAGLTRIAAAANDIVRTRVENFRNVEDAAAKPYSNYGPIYVPVTGGGRTAASLGGRAALSKKDVRKMQQRGLLQAGQGYTRSGKSMRYPDRAAYKRSMGKSGNRDLEESGAMLGAMGPVVISPANRVITMGFTREAERKKAQGNQAIDPWFGLSPRDRIELEPVVQNEVRLMNEKAPQIPPTKP